MAATRTNFRVAEMGSEIEELSRKMGKLWWTESNSDISQKYKRDKYGRLLIPSEERVGGRKKMIDHNKIGVAGSSSGSDSEDSTLEGYNLRISSVYCVGESGRGATEQEPTHHGLDNKLKTSIVMAKDVDRVWSKELYEMDANEREDIIDEMHGVKSKRTVVETPDIVSQGIKELRQQIEVNIHKPLHNKDTLAPPISKEPYVRGVYELGSEYIRTDAFLLRFLRATFFKTEKAELRYFRYLDLIFDLFGDVALTRPLMLSDLTKREMRYLKKGQMQLLPTRDRAGRRMYAFSGCDDWNYNIWEKYRTNIYLLDVLSWDETSQKLGVVTLHAPRIGTTNNPFGFEGMTLRKGKQELLLNGKYTEAEFFRKVHESLPFRLTGMHYFAPNTVIYNIGKAIILSLLGQEERKIVRFHAGSQIECEYSLRGFGIPHEDITITEGGNIKTKNVGKFVNARQSIERFLEMQRMKQQAGASTLQAMDESEAPGIECPEVDCIVFGDKTFNTHSANIDFREIVKVMERDREDTHTRFENKTPIRDFIKRIIQVLREKELRFVVFDKTTHLYVPIDDEEDLIKRVSQTYRDERKRHRLEASIEVKRNENNSFGDTSILGIDATKRFKISRNNDFCLPDVCK